MSELNTVSHMDIFDLCDCLEDDSIDMILCDLPYGITACSWDTVIPFEPMWECFKRIIKPRGAMVLTASGKFVPMLKMSNFEQFKYEWVWIKAKATNPANAHIMPMRKHEQIIVYGDNINYYPVKVPREDPSNRYNRPVNSASGIAHLGGFRRLPHGKTSELKLPDTVLKYHLKCNEQGLHPTQKPVLLFEYLIRTYTQPGEVVFDPCVGSGTTAIAARNTGRNFICGDRSEEYVKVARDRLALPYTLPMFEEKSEEEKTVQEAMF